MTVEVPPVILRMYEELYNQGRVELVDEIYAPEYYSHQNSVNPEGVRGPQGIRETVQSLRTAFPDIRFEILDSIVSGEKVATRWLMTGTMSGTIYGFPPTGVKGQITGITIHRIVNGKVVEAWEEADMLGAFHNFGIMPSAD